tara:strand:+ start:148 stop:1083 length:936 start_codon:yes stop_codon:yes gene_type:complete
MRDLFTFTRRAWLAAVGATGYGISAAGRTLAENDDLLIIDCHAHIYGEDEKKYPTIESPYRPPAGKGTVPHLQQEMRASGVRLVTAIQTSTFYRWDNRFTADTARNNPDSMVAVVTLNPDDPASPEKLRKYVAQSNVRGMRSIPARSGKLDDPGVDKLWTTAEDLGIVINVLVNRDKRPELEKLLLRHPRLRVVMDHCLSLAAGPTLEPTLADMLALAAYPNTHAKLTFIPTGSAQPFPCRDMHDACRAIIAAYGPGRCVWGSDFPCELWCPKVSYRQHLQIFTRELGLDRATQKSVLGETARRLWFQPRA